MQAVSSGLNELQKDLLKLFSVDINEQEMKDIKEMLTQYFSKRLINEANKAWDKKGYNKGTVKRLLNNER
jgi:hypothetical protein